MYLIDKSDKSIELKILGYQFPEIDYDDDSEWLNILINVKTRNIQYEIREPCIRTREIVRMIKGLENLLRGVIGQYETDFMEPDLDIKFESAQIEFRQFFCTAFDEREEVRITSKISKSDLESIIMQLKDEYAEILKGQN
ncbi:MAG: hypothetical protein FWF15_11675 [Oscillospiraceae bacterium]|nr:hypothetical protein [Oscillospiraceae bacterium]